MKMMDVILLKMNYGKRMVGNVQFDYDIDCSSVYPKI